MTSPSKSWNQQQDELCDKINEAMRRRKVLRMCKAAVRASQKWIDNKEGLSTMQSMTWHMFKGS